MRARPASDQQKKTPQWRLGLEVLNERVIRRRDLALSNCSDSNAHLPVDRVLATRVRKLPRSERQRLTGETGCLSFHHTSTPSHLLQVMDSSTINSPKLRKQP